MIQDLFGSQNYQIKVTQILPALYLLEKEDLLQSPELLHFLLNCLKSSWAMVRVHAFDLIVKMPDDIQILNDPEFVEKVLMKTALAFCNSPKAMIAEGGALILKLIFQKCLKHVKFIKSNSRKMA